MNLQQFISETLVQIAKGIEDANTNLKDSTALVNPQNTIVEEKKSGGMYGYLDETKDTKGMWRKTVQAIEFDVAVVAAKDKETKGGVGLAIASLMLGSQGKSSSSNTSESRIKFKIPMVLPNA